MTKYNENLYKVLEAIKDAQALTRKGYYTQLYFNSSNGLDSIDIHDLNRILLQLQDDEKVLKIEAEPSILKPLPMRASYDLFQEKNYFLLDLPDAFTIYYEGKMFDLISSLEVLDWINFLKVYDVTLDIYEQLQLSPTNNVEFRVLPATIRFQELFPFDTVEVRERYEKYREHGLEYLKKKTAIKEYSILQDFDDAFDEGDIKVTLNILEFTEFSNQIRAEYTKRMLRKNDSVKKDDIKNKVIKQEIEDFILFTSDRKIMLNARILLSKPDFNSENEQVFRFLYDNPNKVHTKKQIEEHLKTELRKSIDKILENLGFTKGIRSTFFDVSKKGIMFKNKPPKP